MGINDGLGFEEVNQSEGLTAISYATVHSGTSILGTTISGTTITGPSVYGSTVVSGATIKATTTSGGTIVNTQGVLRSVRQGTVYGAMVQAGSNTFGGGSCWLSFPVAFTSIPQMVIAGYADKDAPSHITQVPYVAAGSTSVGSCYITGSAANIFNWIAVGL